MAAENDKPTRIMVAVNESTITGYPHASISSRGAFEWTLNKIVRSNTSGFKLMFLHVQVHDGYGFDDVDRIYTSPEDFKTMKHRNKPRGLHLLEYFVKQCHEIGVACEAWVKKGDPQEVICFEVQRVQPDLLVVGSRGLGPFQKVLVGTVSEYCTKHADCPSLQLSVLLLKLHETLCTTDFGHCCSGTPLPSMYMEDTLISLSRLLVHCCELCNILTCYSYAFPPLLG